MTILILWVCLSDTVKLDPIDQPVLELSKVKVEADGSFIAASTNFLYHWDQSGKLKLTIGSEKKLINRIESFFVDENFYWICGTNYSGDFASFIFKSDGTFISTSTGVDNFINYFIRFENELFALKAITQEKLFRDPYFFTANKLTYRLDRDKFSFTLKPKFCKFNNRQKELAYNHKRIWISKLDNVYLVMTEVEPKIFLYDALTIKKEHEDGTKIPTIVPSHTLSLEKYVPSPKKPFSLNKPMPIQEKAKARMNWWYSWSRITNFMRFRDGFLVAYEIPNCLTENKNKLCKSSHLGIQRLNKNFNLSGDLLETNGFLMGTLNNKVVIFHNPEGTSNSPIVKLHSF